MLLCQVNCAENNSGDVCGTVGASVILALGLSSDGSWEPCWFREKGKEGKELLGLEEVKGNEFIESLLLVVCYGNGRANWYFSNTNWERPRIIWRHRLCWAPSIRLHWLKVSSTTSRSILRGTETESNWLIDGFVWPAQKLLDLRIFHGADEILRMTCVFTCESLGSGWMCGKLG